MASSVPRWDSARAPRGNIGEGDRVVPRAEVRLDRGRGDPTDENVVETLGVRTFGPVADERSGERLGGVLVEVPDDRRDRLLILIVLAHGSGGGARGESRASRDEANLGGRAPLVERAGRSRASAPPDNPAERAFTRNPSEWSSGVVSDARRRVRRTPSARPPRTLRLRQGGPPQATSSALVLGSVGELDGSSGLRASVDGTSLHLTFSRDFLRMSIF